eukprot:TRINITY_DN2336_c0_g1_i1.p1 TRINITY_DN2336_c0_g1~~TRINITY_DN2336_c0_g1_i1.p1  ORF type:complete len:662 (+),score=150.06 TRINITY_DN2336_c0_g1_i1:70-2055(+)
MSTGRAMLPPRALLPSLLLSAACGALPAAAVNTTRGPIAAVAFGDNLPDPAVAQKWWQLVPAPSGDLYAPPYSHPSVLKIGTADDSVRTFGHFGSGEQKWAAAALLPGTNSIYAAPYGAGRVLRIDTATDSASLVGEEFAGAALWRTCAAADGDLFCPPFGANSILRISERAGAPLVTTFGHFDGPAKWYASAAAQGVVYAVPHSHPSVLRITPASNAAELLGSFPGRSKWAAAALCGGAILAIPYSHSAVLRIDPPTGALSTIGDLDGEAKWASGVCADGALYGIPFRHRRVLRVNATSGSVQLLPTPLSRGGAERAHGLPVLAGDGSIYAPPWSQGGALRIEPRTGAVSLFGDLGSADSKWWAAARSPRNGAVYAAPHSAQQVLKLAPSRWALNATAQVSSSAERQQDALGGTAEALVLTEMSQEAERARHSRAHGLAPAELLPVLSATSKGGEPLDAAFSRELLTEGARIWTDSPHIRILGLPERLVNASVFRGPSEVPEGTTLSVVCPGDPDVDPPCDLSLFASHCPPCTASTSGGWIRSLPAAGWAAGSCAPSWAAVGSDVLHPMVAFHKQIAAGEEEELPAAATNPTRHFGLAVSGGVDCSPNTMQHERVCERAGACSWHGGECVADWCSRGHGAQDRGAAGSQACVCTAETLPR